MQTRAPDGYRLPFRDANAAAPNRGIFNIGYIRRPPPAVQRVLFGALAPIARARGYRGTYPTLSRSALAPRP